MSRVRLLSYSSILLILFVILNSCEDEKPQARTYPRLTSLPVTNITENGATFNADLYSIGTEEIIDYGFVWTTNSNPMLGYADRISLGCSAEEGLFSKEIITTLIEGEEYTVRAFVKTIEHVVYGQNQVFVSLGSQAPQITGFYPTTACWGDTLQITGENFSWIPSHNIVRLNQAQCDVISATDSLITVLIPNTVNDLENEISLEVAGNVAVLSGTKFALILPVLTDFSPKQARWGDTIILKGLRLKSLSGSQFTIKLGTVNCSSAGTPTDSTLKAIVPNNFNLTTGNFSLTINSLILSSQSVFTLMPPVIESFLPQKGLRYSLVTIYGKFNPVISKSIIEINNTSVQILLNTRDSIQFRLPIVMNNSLAAIVYKSVPFEVNSVVPFNVVYPKINQLNPTSARFGESIEIFGENLSSTAGISQVEFGYGLVAIMKSLSESLIIANVPGSIDSIPRKIEISVGHDRVISTESFVLTPHEITSVQASQLIPGGELAITGSGFNSILTSLNVYMDDYSLTIKGANNTEIKATIPKSVPRNPSKISVVSGGYKRSYSLNFILKSPWLRIPVPSNVRYYSSSDRNGGIGFTVNNKGYLIMPYGSMACFNPDTKSFTDLGEQSIFYGTAARISGVVQQDTFYLVISGWRLTSYRFNSSDNSWTALKAPANALYGNGTAFSVANKLYYGLGCNQYGVLVDGSVYQYNSKSNTWSLKTTFPWIASRYVVTSFTFNGKAYLLFHDRFFCEYDPVSNIWTTKASYPVTSLRYDVVSFILNNKPYVGTGKDHGAYGFYDDFYNYNPDSDTWTKAGYSSDDGTSWDMFIPGGTRAGPLNFVINNKLYIGFGYGYNNNHKDFYEFDPNYPLK